MLKLIESILAGRIQTEEIDTVGSAAYRGELATRPSQCIECGKCLSACPVGAISLSRRKLPCIDYKKCVFCGKCAEACAEGTLSHTNLDAMPVITSQNNTEIGRLINTDHTRSLHVRHLDAGSCNACDFEMAALTNPVYDLHRYGISFVASPRHADMIMVTGVVTRNLAEAVLMTYEAMPEPKLVMAVGACAAGGATYGETYALIGALDKILPVDILVPGCPPRPSAMLIALLAASDLYKQRCRHSPFHGEAD